MEIFIKLVLFATISHFCRIECGNNGYIFVNQIELLSLREFYTQAMLNDTLVTKNTTDNIALIKKIKANLEKEHFTFQERKSRGSFSYNDCKENRKKVIEGDGIREYFARRKKPEKGTKNVYPDFLISVYEFPTKEIAQGNFEILNKAVKSGGRFCNGKSPLTLVLNGNEIFHLATRAEMFRTYLEKYGDMIKNFR